MENVISRGWCFTTNNYTQQDETDAMALIDLHKAQYVIYGHEVGEEGTPHLQGYVYFKEKKNARQLKDWLPRSHIEKQTGTNPEAICYAMKDENYFEMGKRPRQGKRSDLDLIYYDMKCKKKTANSIAHTHFPLWCQYRRSFDAFQHLLKEEQNNSTIVICYDKGYIDSPAYLNYLYETILQRYSIDIFKENIYTEFNLHGNPWLNSSSEIFLSYKRREYTVMLFSNQLPPDLKHYMNAIEIPAPFGENL